ncbi:MAG: ArsA family ATPase [Microthrixaceae bacterium]|nr:ArsA family ATPase [Microthrixaceae bacterium]
MPSLLDRRLLFVTGKGGVGKTSVASALALMGARQGKRTLVCEVDAKGNLADFYGVGPLAFQPTEVQPNLFAMAMDTEESLREYLKLQLKLPLLARLGPVARMFDFVATAAPGVKEILTVGKIAYEVRERNYDLVVVDASASGHVVGQLASPVALGELIGVGVVQAQTAWMIELLKDPKVTGVVVVATPEEMPVNETLELVGRLGTETEIDLAGVVANRVLPELFGRAEEELFEELGRRVRSEDRGESQDLAELDEAMGPTGRRGLAGVVEAAELAVGLRRSRVPHLKRLRAGLPQGVALVNVPMLFIRTHGTRVTHAIADLLEDELL